MAREKIDIAVLAEKYRNLINDEGYKAAPPEKDDDGDLRVVVKFEGMSLLIYFDNEDTQFVRIILPNFYSLDTDEEKLKSLSAVNQVAAKCKGAKAFINPAQDNVMCAVEFLENGASLTIEMLIRNLNMLVGAAKFFAVEMRK